MNLFNFDEQCLGARIVLFNLEPIKPYPRVRYLGLYMLN